MVKYFTRILPTVYYLVASDPCSTTNEAAIPFKDHLERSLRNIYIVASNNLVLGLINFGKMLNLVPEIIDVGNEYDEL